MKFKLSFSIFRTELFKSFLIFESMILFFFYKIFFGFVYTPANLYQAMLPWNNYSQNYDSQGALLSDPIDTLLPRKMYLIEKIKEGELSLWNPYHSMGSPMELYFITPFDLPYFIFPHGVASTIYVISVLTVASLGMYTLLRGFDVEVSAARIGAVIFTFSLPMIVWLNWPHTDVAALAPWFLWSMQKVYTGNKKHIAISSILLSFMLLCHMPSYAAYYLYITGFYYLFRMITEVKHSRNWSSFVKQGLNFIFAIIIGLLLSSAYILNFLHISGSLEITSQRSGMFEHAFDCKYLISLLIPFYLREINAADMHMNEYSGYFGVSSFLLVICALLLALRRKQFNYKFWSISFIIIFLSAYGLFPFLGYLPIVGSSLATRLISLIVFIAAILVSLVFSDILKKKSRKIMYILKSLFIFFLLASISIYFSGEVLINRSVIIHSTILFATVVVLICYLHGFFSQKIFSYTMIAIIFTQLFITGFDYNPNMRNHGLKLNMSTDSIDYVKKHLDGNGRFVALGRWIFFPNTSTFYGISDVRGHSQIVTDSRHVMFFNSIDKESYQTRTRVTLNKIENFNLIRAASVKYVLSPFPLGSNIIQNNVMDSNIGKIPVGEITGDVDVIQEFKSLKNNLSGVSILFATYKTNFTSKEALNFEITDDQGEILRKGLVPLNKIADNTYYRITFDPIIDSYNKKFKIRLTTEGTYKGHAPTVWVSKSNTYNEGRVSFNKKVIEGDMFFSTVYADENTDFKLLEEKDGLFIYEINNTLPRAYMVSNIVNMTGNEDEILNAISSNKILDTAFVEGLSSPLKTEIKNQSYEQVNILEDHGDEIIMNVETGSEKFLVLTDNFFPGWKAYVDGNETPIYKTNYLFKGVVVPEGTHEIKFVYRPPYYVLQNSLSILGIIIVIFMLFRYRKRSS